MRILMFGRGVIATLYGRVLDAAGHDVEFFVRPGRAAHYGDAVHIDWIDGRRRPFGRRVRESYPLRLRETLDAGDGFDLVVLSVGHHQLPEAAAFLAPRLGAATVLVLGNIWQEPVAALAPIPADRLVFGFPQAGGGFRDDGLLWGAMLSSVVIGATPGGDPGADPGAEPAGEVVQVAHATFAQRQQQIVAAFRRAGIATRREPDMRGWLWLHFIADAGMFDQALRSGSLASMIGDRRAFRDAFLTTRELLPIVEARGVDLHRHRFVTMSSRMPGVVATAVAGATRLMPIAQRSLAAHTDPHAAEARAVLDDTLREARRLGIPTPRLER